MSRRIRGGVTSRSISAAVLTGVVVLLAGTAGSAATFSVTTTADGGVGSLRQAITDANASTDATSTITFNASLKGGRIGLLSALPAIIKSLTITGPNTSAAGITISGGNRVQIMRVDREGTLNLQYVTLTDGTANQGGAIANEGTLTVTNSALTTNSATGTDSRGGAIINHGTLTIINSTFASNQGRCGPGSNPVSSGGAIFNSNSLTIANSTFVGNLATCGADSRGGAMFNEQAGKLTITNSTLSSNLATGKSGLGGAIYTDGYSAITNATFSGNQVVGATVEGGGIRNRGRLQIKGTILAKGTGDNCDGNFEDRGYDLSDDGSCSFHGTGSRNDLFASDLALGSLASNGGPTQTIALTSDTSVAVDQIPTSPTNECTDLATGQPLKTDQRGFSRPDPEDGSNGKCDVGAYEFGAVPPNMD